MPTEDQVLNTPVPPPMDEEEIDEALVLGTQTPPAPDAAPGIEVEQGALSAVPGPDVGFVGHIIKVEPTTIGATATPVQIEELDAAAALQELNRAVANNTSDGPAQAQSALEDASSLGVDPWTTSPGVRRTLKEAEAAMLHLRKLLEQSQAEAGLLRAEAARNEEKLAEADRMATEMEEARGELNNIARDMQIQAVICRDHHTTGDLNVDLVRKERETQKIETRHIRRRVQHLEQEVRGLTAELKFKDRAYNVARGQYKSILLVNNKLRQRLAESAKKPAGKLSRRQRARRAQEARNQEAQQRVADVPVEERALVIVEEPVESATVAGPEPTVEIVEPVESALVAGPEPAAEGVPMDTSAPAIQVPDPKPVSGYVSRSQARAAAYKARRAARAAARASAAMVAPSCPVVSGKEADAAAKAVLPRKAMWRADTGMLLPPAHSLLTAGNSVPLGGPPPTGSSEPKRAQQGGQSTAPPVSTHHPRSRGTPKHPRRSREPSQSRGHHGASQHRSHHRSPHRHAHRRHGSPNARPPSRHHRPEKRRH